jgi:hypothetical protein
MSLDNFTSLSPAEQQALLSGPALPPPPGVLSDFDDPPNGNAEGASIMAICLFAVAVSGLMRIYSRIFVVKRARVEDCKSCPSSCRAHNGEPAAKKIGIAS